MPLLWYARTVLTFQGWTVHTAAWPADMAPDQTPEMAAAAVDRAFGTPSTAPDNAAEAGTPATRLIIGKSLGSLALPLALERDLPGVWLTPLLFEPAVAAATQNLGAGHLLVGGTADESSWDRDVAQHSGAQLLEIPGGGHTLEVPGDLDRTLGALERVVDAINAFALELRQPAEPRPF